MGIMANLWARKSTAALLSESVGADSADDQPHLLRRTLSALNLVALGIGGIIGAGIFVLTGHAAAANAGPAVSLSFLLGATACAFAGLCYAEMVSAVRSAKPNSTKGKRLREGTAERSATSCETA